MKAPRCSVTVWGRVWKGHAAGGWTKPHYHQCSKAGNYEGLCHLHARGQRPARVTGIERAIDLLRANGYLVMPPVIDLTGALGLPAPVVRSD